MALRTLRSSSVVLGSMGVLAAALTACSSEPDRRCVDRDSYDTVRGYRIVDDSQCSSSSGSSGGGGGSASSGGSTSGSSGYTSGSSGYSSGSSGYTSGSGGYSRGADWYYGGKASNGRVESGSFVRSTAVNRGGFGCSGSGTRGG